MQYIPAKTIITHKPHSETWFGTDLNMNIYRGCCHGCIYCDSRSECYGVTDFDTVKAKAGALETIERDLSKRTKTGVIATGAMSDPYNPFEKELRLTRGALELIERYNFGIAIATKSPLVVRDTDILKRIARYSPALVKMTVTTYDDGLCRKIEPNVAASSERFYAIKRLSEAGIYCGVLIMPVLPYINDTPENIISIVRKAAQNGARFVYPAFGVTLRGNQRQHFYQMLDLHFPGVKEMYIEHYSGQYSCHSPDAEKLMSDFKAECERLGLLYKMRDIIESYKSESGGLQLDMF